MRSWASALTVFVLCWRDTPHTHTLGRYSSLSFKQRRFWPIPLSCADIHPQLQSDGRRQSDRVFIVLLIILTNCDLHRCLSAHVNQKKVKYTKSCSSAVGGLKSQLPAREYMNGFIHCCCFSLFCPEENIFWKITRRVEAEEQNPSDSEHFVFCKQEQHSRIAPSLLTQNLSSDLVSSADCKVKYKYKSSRLRFDLRESRYCRYCRTKSQKSSESWMYDAGRDISTRSSCLVYYATGSTESWKQWRLY